MNHNAKLLLAVLSITFVFTSCAVKKRSYQKGYYADWVFSKHPKKEVDHKKTETIEKNIIKISALKETKHEIENAAVASNKIDIDQFTVKKNITLNLSDTCGDVLLLKIGEKLRGKVIEITDDIIKYKRCDNINGPTYSIGKEKVHSITYVNGYKEIIEPPQAKKQIVKNTHKGYPGSLLWGTILPFLASIIGIMISIPLLLKAKRLIRTYPDNYKGLNFANFMLSFDIIILLALAATIFILIITPYSYYAIYVVLFAAVAIIISAIYNILHK